MTLEQLEALDKEMLTPAEIAPILGVQPYSINLQAKQAPQMLGFPVICMGTRVKIPKRPFIRFVRGE